MNRKTTVSLAVATAVAIPFVSAGTAFACHPKGEITKTVQNVTTNGVVSDANSVKDAVSAKPGDTLRYTITIKNAANKNAEDWDDMINTVMTDTLPAGVELVSNPQARVITEAVGTVAPGKSFSKSYDVKVTSTTNKAVIKNTACYKGDSKDAKQAQSGCDDANIVVDVPETPKPTPTPTPTPPATTTPTPAPQPTTLPNTGAGSSVIAIGVMTGVFGYIVSRLLQRRFN